jgi:hypothetical protein
MNLECRTNNQLFAWSVRCLTCELCGFRKLVIHKMANFNQTVAEFLVSALCSWLETVQKMLIR